MGVIDDLLATATQPPSFAVEDYSWGADGSEAGWDRTLGSGEPTVPAKSVARFNAKLGEAWDNRVVHEWVRG